MPALSNEWGKLAQENYARVESSDTIDFILHTDFLQRKKVTYASFLCDHHSLKDEKWRIRLVVGGDKLPYELDSRSLATDLLEIKLLLNSVMIDANIGAQFLSMDLKDMFLQTPIHSLEFMKVAIKYFPQDFIEKKISMILYIMGIYSSK